MARKKPKQYDDDDGRVFADMSVPGMPKRVLQRYEDIKAREQKEKNPIDLNKSEQKSIIRGVVLAHVVFALVLFGLLALFVLLYVNLRA